MKTSAYILTAAQYACLAIVLAGGRVFSPSAPGWTLIGLSGVLAGWAFVAFRVTTMRITPLPAPGGRLVTSGPYRFIRHPMYASVLLGVGGLLLVDLTMLRVAASIGLVPSLIGKLLVEERLLCSFYKDYAEYMQRTRRLIPGVW